MAAATVPAGVVSVWRHNDQRGQWELVDFDGRVVAWITDESWVDARRTYDGRALVRARFGSTPPWGRGW